MLRVYTATFLIFACTVVDAQESRDLDELEVLVTEANDVVGYCDCAGHAKKLDVVYSYKADETVEKAVMDILSKAGLHKRPFALRAAKNTDVAMATMLKNRRVVFYNPSLKGRLEKADGKDWAVLAVLAHEIAHHLYEHTLKLGNKIDKTERHQDELDADWFSTVMLTRLGATRIEEIQAGLERYANEEDTETHPAKEIRKETTLRAFEKERNTNTPAENVGPGVAATKVDVATEPKKDSVKKDATAPENKKDAVANIVTYQFGNHGQQHERTFGFSIRPQGKLKGAKGKQVKMTARFYVPILGGPSIQIRADPREKTYIDDQGWLATNHSFECDRDEYDLSNVELTIPYYAFQVPRSGYRLLYIRTFTLDVYADGKLAQRVGEFEFRFTY